MTARLHPSYLELDQLFVGAGSADARQHVDACAECRAHLERVRAPVSLPDWLRQPKREGWRTWRWGWPAAALAGCALALVVLGVGYRDLVSPTANDPYQVKATAPGVALYVKRGEQIEVWDGKRPVEPGDLLRLQLAPEGFHHLTVDSPASPGTHLFDGDVPETIALLPVSWRVDDKPGPEILDITLTSPNVTPWHASLVLPKRRP